MKTLTLSINSLLNVSSIFLPTFMLFSKNLKIKFRTMTFVSNLLTKIAIARAKPILAAFSLNQY